MIQRPAPPSPKPIAGIRHMVAVASGKGGVGKSTVAANLAVTLAQAGYRTGLVDADIYGPSVARMMGLSGEPTYHDKKIVPPEAHGVKCMTMGILLDENAPAVWRGPMATKALAQLMLGTGWGELDILVLDLPPGTGDIHLSIAQNYKLSGAVIVSTPQEVALMDVKKAITMFEKVNIPVFGLVENMSYFIDPESGQYHHLFGEGNVQQVCDKLSLPLLATLPIDPAIAEGGDNGTPYTASHSDTTLAASYATLAQHIIEQL